MKIIINNLATEYKDEGAGPVILMLHGWGVDLGEFDKISEILKENFRIVRVDLPGFGGTEMPKKWNLDDYVKFVKLFIEKFELDKEQDFAILGHSFGGRIILKGVGGDKLSAEKIIMISPAGVSLKNQRRSVFKVVAKIGGLLVYIPPFVFWRKIIREKMYKMIGSDYLEQGNMSHIFKSVVGEDLSHCAKKIDTETLLIWGEHDTVTPKSDGEHLHHLLKNSKMEIVKGAGHFSFDESPEEVAGMIRKFLDQK